jgi:nucleotide-binding universal stress UspA family protein
VSQDPDRHAIVVAVDFTEMTDFVIEAAARQAEGRAPAVLHAACVLDQSTDVLGRRAADAGELALLEEALEARVAADLGQRGLEAEVHALIGKPWVQILALAERVRAELIVLGRHSQSPRRPKFLGSVPSRVLAEARCDVLVVQPRDYPED